MKWMSLLLACFVALGLSACAKKCPREPVCVSNCGVYSHCDRSLISPYGKSPCYRFGSEDCKTLPNACAERRRGDYWGCRSGATCYKQ
jgi:hypothetical protein